jgi:hypothetical protein
MSLLDRIAPKVYTQPMVDAIVAVAVEKALLERDTEGPPPVDVDGDLRRLLLQQMAAALPEDAPDEILYQVRRPGVGWWDDRKPDAWIMHFVKCRWGCQVVLRWERLEAAHAAEDTTEDHHG